MAFTVISAMYPPQIDPTRVPLAYGDRALPKLNRELQVGPCESIETSSVTDLLIIVSSVTLL